MFHFRVPHSEYFTLGHQHPAGEPMRMLCLPEICAVSWGGPGALSQVSACAEYGMQRSRASAGGSVPGYPACLTHSHSPYRAAEFVPKTLQGRTGEIHSICCFYPLSHHWGDPLYLSSLSFTSLFSLRQGLTTQS